MLGDLVEHPAHENDHANAHERNESEPESEEPETVSVLHFISLLVEVVGFSRKVLQEFLGVESVNRQPVSATASIGDDLPARKPRLPASGEFATVEDVSVTTVVSHENRAIIPRRSGEFLAVEHEHISRNDRVHDRRKLGSLRHRFVFVHDMFFDLAHGDSFSVRELYPITGHLSKHFRYGRLSKRQRTASHTANGKLPTGYCDW